MSSSYQLLAVGGAWADSRADSQSVTKCHKVDLDWTQTGPGPELDNIPGENRLLLFGQGMMSRLINK